MVWPPSGINQDAWGYRAAFVTRLRKPSNTLLTMFGQRQLTPSWNVRDAHELNVAEELMVVLTPERSSSQRNKIVVRRNDTAAHLNWRLILALTLNFVAWAGLVALVMSFL